MRRNIFLRTAALLLALVIGTAPITVSRAKYVTVLPYGTTFYITKATTALSKTGSAHTNGTANVNSTSITNSMQASYFTTYNLKAGWWAFVLRGGRGSICGGTSGLSRTNTTASGHNGGTTGQSGLVYGCMYFPTDTVVYACAGSAGAGEFEKSTRMTGNATYGGGSSGTGGGDRGNGGGASLLTMGDPPSSYTGTSSGALTVSAGPYSSYRQYLFNNRYTAIIAVAGGGGGDGGGSDNNNIAKVAGGNGGKITSPNGSSGYTIANGTKGTPLSAGSGNNKTAGFGGGDVATDGRAIYLSSFSYADSNGDTDTSGIGNGGGHGWGLIGGWGAYGNTGWFLQGGSGPSGCYAGGGGSGWCGGGSGGQDNGNWDDGAGGGGSSFAAQYVYPLPTLGYYKYAYEYFNHQGYFATTGSANAHGLVCLVYMGLDYDPGDYLIPNVY